MSSIVIPDSKLNITPEEAVMLGAADGLFFAKYFFPHLVRQRSPSFHREVWDLFALNRFSSAMVFRGGAKTTLMRIIFAHRISYGLLHTGLFLGKSEGHAAEHVIWLEREVEYNELWYTTFGLKRGNLWNQTECEIIHKIDNYPLRLQAMGMWGSVRGINVHGHRPDTIGVDDPLDEENSATQEQRRKGTDLYFSAVKESLVPESEDPTARLMLTQTPFDEDDLSYVCHKSSQIASIRVGILTSEDDASAESAWPDRWPKEEILADKAAAVERNQLSLWLREKMCLIVSKETSEFRAEWLKYYTIIPPGAIYIGAIDPAPIQSDKARLTGALTDLQAIMVCAYWRGHKYIVEYATARDQDPEAVSRELHRLATKYPIRGWGVESVAYQRTLKWYLEREMQAGRLRHLRIVEVPAPKGKTERIVQAHSGRASSGCLHVKVEHVEFIDDFTRFPNIRFKDRLDVSAQCDMVISPRQEQTIDAEYSVVDEKSIPRLEDFRGSP